MNRLLPAPMRAALRGRLGEATDRYLRWRHPAHVRELPALLASLGVRRGGVLLVHSSFDAFRGIEGASPFEVIRLLQEAVGPEGTVLMPTIPFEGSAVAYAAGGPLFDVRRTPSRMGLLTELFRRMPGAQRSVHPTHSVAARGPHATALLADHHHAGTPCGVPSPYARLLDNEGQMLFLGVGIGTMTLLHTIDELFEGRLPFAPFTREVYRLESRDADGTIVETRTRLFDQAANEARDRFEARLEPRMRRRGTWRAGRLGALRAIVLDARDVRAAVEEILT